MEKSASTLKHMSQVRLYDGDVEGDEALEGVQVKTQYSKGYALSDNLFIGLEEIWSISRTPRV